MKCKFNFFVRRAETLIFRMLFSIKIDLKVCSKL